MLPNDFFEDRTGLNGLSLPTFDVALVRALRSAPLATVGDAEVGVALARLVHDELTTFGTTGGQTLNDAEMREALAALRSICVRLNVSYTVPFRDFATFKGHWQAQGASGSGGWQARRNLLSDTFEPMHEQLEALEQNSLAAVLATPITPRSGTGWPQVDAEIGELRRQFLVATTAQDFNAVGLVAVRVVEAVSAAAYRREQHLRSGEDEPPVASTKQRLERVVEVAAVGPEGADLRRLVKTTITYAQAVKHKNSPTRRDAGIAADAALMLSNIIRRLVEP